jgi:type IV pilus assembly protein PilE
LPPTSGVENFSYCCAVSNSGQNFTYTATGKGSTTGFVYTVDDAGVKSTTSLGAGWTGGSTCWVKSNGATC